MNARQRRISVLAILAVVSLGMSAAAMAWACSPQAYIFLSSTGGHAGQRMTVNGHGFIDGPVQIRWNGAYGALVGTTRGPDFSTTIRVPANAAPGIAYIHGVARDAAGRLVGDAVKAFRVVRSKHALGCRGHLRLSRRNADHRLRLSRYVPCTRKQRPAPDFSTGLLFTAALRIGILFRVHWRRDEACAGAIDVDWRRARVSC